MSKNFINFPICLHFGEREGYNESGKAARGWEAAQNTIFTEAQGKPGFYLRRSAMADEPYFSGTASVHFPRLTDKEFSERVTAVFSGIIYHDLLLGSGRLRPEVVKTGEVPSEPYRPGRKLHPLKKCRKTCRKWVTREENSVMIDPIGGFCYGNDKTKETKKIPGKTKRGAHDGSTCTGCADSGRHNVRFPL